MDIACSTATLQRNVNQNSTKKPNNGLMDMGAKSFSFSLEASRKEMRPNPSKHDFATKDLKSKPVEIKKPKQTNPKPKLNSKEKAKVNTDTSNKDSSKKELNKEVDVCKELSAKEEVSENEKVVSDELLKQIAMMISNFTNRPLEEVMASLKEKLLELDTENLLADGAELKELVLSELLGDKNPVFSNDDEVKLIKDILNTLEMLLENLGDDDEKDINFEDVMLAMANQGKELDTQQPNLTEQGEQNTSLEIKEEPSKIEVVDLRKEQKSSDNDLKGNAQFTEVLFKEDLAKTDANFEVKTVENVNTAEIIDQIATKVKVTLEDGKSQVEMKLNPEHLGKVGIKLISENGTVKGTFTVENETVKHAVEQNLINLKAQLEESGIKIEKIEVALASTGEEKQFNDKENTNRQFNKKSNKNKNTYGAIEEINSLEDEIETESLIEDSIVNYSA